MEKRVIITALLDRDIEKELTTLREKFFPKEINYLPAHITLFHAAPLELVENLNLIREPMPMSMREPVFFGRGFGIKVDCPELKAWRRDLLKLPLEFTPQDENSNQLHVTLQNKTQPDRARKDFEKFKEIWKKFDSQVFGVQIWKYLGGPWELLETKKFSAS